MTLLGDRDHFKFHNISASIWLVSRDTVPKQITLSRLTMAAHYSCTVLVSVGTVPSVSTPCAAIWVTAPLHPGPACETTTLGQSGIKLNQHVKRRTLRACVGLSDFNSDCRLYHWAWLLSETIYRHACKTDWTIKACLQSLYVSLGRSYVASATSTNCSRKLWLVRIQAVEKISLLNYSVQTQSTVGHVA